MKTSIQILTLVTSGHLAAANLISHKPSWAFNTAVAAAPIGEIAAFTIPAYNTRSIPTFLVVTSIQGNYTGKTLTASFSTTGTAPISYYGAGTSWNNCTTPANVRFFISSTAGYNLNDSSGAGASKYWWSNSTNYVFITPTGQYTLTAAVDPATWSNGLGKTGIDDPAGWTNAITHIYEAGLNFSGGCFYDMGILTTTAATDTFHWYNFSVQ